MENGLNRQSSLTGKLKSSICCFAGAVHHDGELFYNKFLHLPKTPTTPISPMSWFKKSPNNEFGDQPRVKGRSIMSRRGRRHHRQSQSADFSYDPSSYALNFESECRADDEEFPFRNFNSRLPASPPTSSSLPSTPTMPSPPSLKYAEELPVTVTKEIVGFS